MRRHYGIEKNDITIEPQAIVLHYTAINSFISTWNYFNRTRIETERPELQRESELNVSAQFLIDRDGTIYRLMPENWMARHCIGLNHVAIGVENVGDEKDFPLTDAQVDANAALVRYLARKFPIVYLLGHNEYRRMEKTPLFHEAVPGYRTAKSDPGEKFMSSVRGKLANLDLRPRRVPSPCLSPFAGNRQLSSAPAFAAKNRRSGIIAGTMKTKFVFFIALSPLFCVLTSPTFAQSTSLAPKPPVILHAASLLEIESGKIITPGEVLVQDDRIVEVGSLVKRPAAAQLIDLGDTTLLPGLIDVHVHLFLHPGAEDLQTVEESVPQRTIIATLAAREDLMAGFTAERDMGTEGAGSADTAVRNAINHGEIPGPRLRISGNAVDILGGHEDAIHYNPEQHVLSNATYANNSAELVTVIRQQVKEGADFIKIYETGPDSLRDGRFSTPFQYTEAELRAAVEEAARIGKHVAVHATGEPGTLYAALAGVVSVDHAYYLSDETMRIMREKQIFAVPTFAIAEYFADHAASPAQAAREHRMLDFHAQEFRKQLAAGVPMAVGSDVGPFPHGTQARELILMVKYGMTPLAALQANLLNGAKLLGWQDQIGALKPGYLADIIAVPGNPLSDITVLQNARFVMKGGVVYRTIHQ